MNPKIQAAVNILLFVATMLAGGVIMYFMLETLGLVKVGIAVTGVLLAYMLKMAYDAEVSRLQSLERLNRNQ
jgi:uncharacterized membrane protein YgaE (UPF0421/DUF939 family)